MSQHHQSGHHPDADQLNAFVEHALPPHEREHTLAHLAACPACRAIVALSLPLDEAPAKPHARPARKPWFSGWNLAWPVAAAFAALVPLVYFVHRSAGTPAGPAAPIQMAQSQPPAAPEPPAAAQPPTATAPSPRPAMEHNRPAEPSTPPPTAAPAMPASPGAAAKTPAYLDTQDASTGGTIENELYSQLPLAMNRAARNASPKMRPGAQSKPGSGAGQGAGNGSSGVYGGTGQTNLNENYLEAMPTANMAASADAASAATGAAAATVAVTNAPPLETTDAALAGLLRQDRARPAPAHLASLPSGLPILSAATSGRVTLALDSAHALFVSDSDSDDGGRRWRPVPAPWPGHAVRVDLAGRAAAPVHMAALGAGLARSPAAFSPQPAPPPAPNSGIAGSITGVVTDPSGAVIPNASIVVTDAARQAVVSVRTDSIGRYRIDSLAPGHYRLTAFAPGFQRLEQPIALEPAQRNQVNLALQVGADTTTVTVTDAPPRIDTATRSQAANKAAAPTLKAAAPAVIPQVAAMPPAPLFEVTTESGDRWTSPDGQTWTRRP